LLVSGCGDATTTATTTSASPQSATSAPKPTLTPKPSPTLNTTQTPLYGGDLRDFQAKYGNDGQVHIEAVIFTVSDTEKDIVGCSMSSN